MSLLHLFICKSKGEEQLDHYLNNYFCHCCRRRDLDIDIKSVKEDCDRLEQVDKHIESRTAVDDGLTDFYVTTTRIYD